MFICIACEDPDILGRNYLHCKCGKKIMECGLCSKSWAGSQALYTTHIHSHGCSHDHGHDYDAILVKSFYVVRILRGPIGPPFPTDGIGIL